jgi:zinc and cadmium transporter
MSLVTTYTMLSVILVSLVSFVGVLSVFIKKKQTQQFLLILVSVSAGTLFGGAFLHLLPEVVEAQGFGLRVSLLILAGMIVFFVLEKFIHWKHCHSHIQPNKYHTHAQKKGKQHIAPLNLLGDALHNFLDGLIIAGSYMVSIPAGIATTVAVIFHEVPQEIADFGVLLYSGLTKAKALLFNFLSATVAIIGAVIGLVWGASTENFVHTILPFAAGGFVYIGGANLIPELHKECGMKDSFWHIVAMLAGIGIMVGLKFIE